MHDGAMQFGKHFFDLYVENNEAIKIVDVGSQDVNGSCGRSLPKNADISASISSPAPASISY